MVNFISTVENSGIDRYSQELSKRMAVPTLQSRRYLSLKESFFFFNELNKILYPIHFSSHHFARYGLFLRTPFIVTVHDIVRMCFPFSKETLFERMWLKMDIFGLKRAKHIITVSLRTKADLMHHLNISGDKINVIHNGIDRSVFKPQQGNCFDFPYLLYVGSERPRKNFRTLLKGFQIFKESFGTIQNLKLLKVGGPGRTENFRKESIFEVRRLGLESDVIFLEHVSDEDLPRYYSEALALVMPSLYEGFGLPLLEAMACGCPVIASNTSSHPEVAGNAALFFKPNDSSELARLIHSLIINQSLRRDLIVKGFKRVKHFSWENAAQETLRVYRKVEANLGIEIDNESRIKNIECNETNVKIHQDRAFHEKLPMFSEKVNKDGPTNTTALEKRPRTNYFA